MQFEVYEAAVYSEGEPQSKDVLPAVQKAELPKLDASIALWLILFVFGGGLLALYYAGISYFPEVSWQDALTFMALMTIIGGSLLLAYSFLLFVPGAIWSEFLICDGQLNKVLTMDARPSEPCVWTISKQILFPFAIFMAFCHFLLYEGGSPRLVPWGAAASLAAVSGLLGRSLREKLEPPRSQPPSVRGPGGRSTLRWHRVSICAAHFPFFLAFIAKAYFHRRPVPELLWLMALLPLVSCAALLIEGWIERRSLQPCSESSNLRAPMPPGKSGDSGALSGGIPDEFSLLCRAILAFGSAALLSLAALWFFYRIYEGGSHATAVKVPSALLLMCTFVVIVTNLVVSVLFEKHRRQALAASFLAALLLLGAGQLLESDAKMTMPEKIMEGFGFGGPSATLVVTERGGRILCQEGIAVQFEEVESAKREVAEGAEVAKPGSRAAIEGKPAKEGVLARAAGMTILSRLGSEYLFRSDNPGRTITLPKGEFVSWSTSPKGQDQKVRDGCNSHGVSGL